MGRTNKTANTAPETAKAAPEALEVSQDTQEPEEAPAGAEAGQSVAFGEPAEQPETVESSMDLPPLEYAVSGCSLLNLRERPGLDAPVLAVLPQGAGVLSTGRVYDEWWQVTTGRLTGWVMTRYLEQVWT